MSNVDNTEGMVQTERLQLCDRLPADRKTGAHPSQTPACERLQQAKLLRDIRGRQLGLIAAGSEILAVALGIAVLLWATVETMKAGQ